MNTAALIIINVILFIICIILIYHLLKTRREFKQWKETEQKKLADARKGAIEQSRAVLGGKFTEQMAPYLPEFKYDPTEARFIGSPVDLVVFPGLAKDNPSEVVFIEVKTGKSSGLTTRERNIQRLIEAGKVRWELIHRPPEKEEAIEKSSEMEKE
jgi:predicted Holliday junction resolvase-like endonuclease